MLPCCPLAPRLRRAIPPSIPNHHLCRPTRPSCNPRGKAGGRANRPAPRTLLRAAESIREQFVVEMARQAWKYQEASPLAAPLWRPRATTTRLRLSRAQTGGSDKVPGRGMRQRFLIALSEPLSCPLHDRKVILLPGKRPERKRLSRPSSGDLCWIGTIPLEPRCWYSDCHRLPYPHGITISLTSTIRSTSSPIPTPAAACRGRASVGLATFHGNYWQPVSWLSLQFDAHFSGQTGRWTADPFLRPLFIWITCVGTVAAPSSCSPCSND